MATSSGCFRTDECHDEHGHDHGHAVACAARCRQPRVDPRAWRAQEPGKSVIVIEHHQAVMAHADWIIDLGPGAGHDGGRIVFEGTPADLVAARTTLTGEHLAAYIGT